MSAELPWLQQELQQRLDAGLLRQRRITTWLADGVCEADGRRVFNFISNDYLNLASDPRVIEAAREALAEAGVGSRASALLGGRTDWHARLEQRIAEFEREPAAILFPSGWAANIGTLTALVQESDVVFSDRLNHASLIDGCRLSKARLRIYRHDDVEQLAAELRKTASFPRRWIVTDGAFSMDGNLAPLPDLCDLAEQFDAKLIVDEAHATGVFGPTGRGVAEHFGVEHRIAVRIGTLSKAVGALGGFVAGSQALIDFLWNSARSQIYSTALPPAVCAAAEMALTIIQTEPERRQRLHQLSDHLRRQLQNHDVAILPASTGPIVPIVLHDPQRAVQVAKRLEQGGFLVGAIRPPTVSQGTSRLRISMSTAHNEQRVADLAHAVATAIREVG